MGLFNGRGSLGSDHHRAFSVISESRASDTMLRFFDCCQRYEVTVNSWLSSVWYGLNWPNFDCVLLLKSCSCLRFWTSVVVMCQFVRDIQALMPSWTRIKMSNFQLFFFMLSISSRSLKLVITWWWIKNKIKINQAVACIYNSHWSLTQVMSYLLAKLRITRPPFCPLFLSHVFFWEFSSWQFWMGYAPPLKNFGRPSYPSTGTTLQEGGQPLLARFAKRNTWL